MENFRQAMALPFIVFFLIILISFSFGNGQELDQVRDEIHKKPVAHKRVSVRESLLDAPVEDIQWAGLQHTSVFAVTKTGRLYRSLTRGSSLSDISSMLTALSGSNEEVQVHKLIIHPVTKIHVVIIAKGNQNFVSEDSGTTFRKLNIQMHIHNFLFHPHDYQFALFSSWSDGCNNRKDPCQHSLYSTGDFGKSYHKVTDYVVQYLWGDTSTNKASTEILYTAHEGATGNQPRFSGWHDSVHFFRTIHRGSRPSKLLSGGNKFLSANGFMFVAQLKDKSSQTVQLMVSTDSGYSFKKAKLPIEDLEHSYTIVDTSDKSAIVHINHGKTHSGSFVGHVYVSDETGTQFSLSLPGNIRSSSGECEFDKVQGLDGIYIANYRDVLPGKNSSISDMTENDEDEVEGQAGGDEVARRHKKTKMIKLADQGTKTAISFDKGALWKGLKAPQVDSRGQPIVCAGVCNLHLHGITHFDRYAPFYSVDNAPGIIMGTGNVGAYLSEDPTEVNTFLSRDGGKTWNEVHKGAFIYEFGDHGGLLVMVDDIAKTKQVVFSWDDGRSWFDFDVSNTPIQVDNVVIEPTSSGMDFLLYGERSGGVGVVYHLDFKTLGQSPCHGADSPNTQSSDYEVWTPTGGDASANGQCMLGRRFSVVRRKATSDCFNGREFARKVDLTPCQCSVSDYQCAPGFFRRIDGPGDCYPSPYKGDEIDIPGCTSSGTFMATAYTKIPGDKCVGGYQPAKVSVPCPPSSPFTTNAKISLYAILIIAVCVGLVQVASRHPKLKRYIQHTGFDNFVDIGYHVVGKAGGLAVRGGEEIYSAWSATINSNNLNNLNNNNNSTNIFSQTFGKSDVGYNLNSDFHDQGNTPTDGQGSSVGLDVAHQQVYNTSGFLEAEFEQLNRTKAHQKSGRVELSSTDFKMERRSSTNELL